MYKNLNNGAFDNFDPNNLDGDGSDTSQVLSVASARPGQKLQINLTLANPTAGNLTIELFSYLDSCVRRQKPEYISGNWKYIPLSSFQGIAAIIAATDGCVGFDKDGNLAIHGLPADLIATAKCKEIAYSSLFVASAVIPFTVAYLRMTTATDAQFDESLIYFSKTFSGGIEENSISPRSYKRPNQFSTDTVDLTVQFSIGIDKGLRVNVLPTATVKLALFVQLWTA